MTQHVVMTQHDVMIPSVMTAERMTQHDVMTPSVMTAERMTQHVAMTPSVMTAERMTLREEGLQNRFNGLENNLHIR